METKIKFSKKGLDGSECMNKITAHNSSRFDGCTNLNVEPAKRKDLDVIRNGEVNFSPENESGRVNVRSNKKLIFI